jgi:hypothetical protein
LQRREGFAGLWTEFIHTEKKEKELRTRHTKADSLFPGVTVKVKFKVHNQNTEEVVKKSSPTVYNCLIPDKMINRRASTVISESPTAIHTLTIMVHSILAPRKGSSGSSSAFSR